MAHVVEVRKLDYLNDATALYSARSNADHQLFCICVRATPIDTRQPASVSFVVNGASIWQTPIVAGIDYCSNLVQRILPGNHEYSITVNPTNAAFRVDVNDYCVVTVVEIDGVRNPAKKPPKKTGTKR